MILSKSHSVITQFLVTFQNLLKNKIKGVGRGRKIKVEILDVFKSPIVSILCQKMKENADFRKKKIYYWIIYVKIKSKGIIIFLWVYLI